jgi:hypothetical protein
MRSSSNLDIWSGLIFLAFLAAIPTILTWQAQNTLEPYGALDKVNFVVRHALDDLKVARILGAINSLLVILAGVLIGLRRRFGYYLLIGLCCIAVADAVFAVVETRSVLGRAVIQFFFWGFMLAFVLRKNHLYGGTWWRAKVGGSV